MNLKDLENIVKAAREVALAGTDNNSTDACGPIIAVIVAKAIEGIPSDEMRGILLAKE